MTTRSENTGKAKARFEQSLTNLVKKFAPPLTADDLIPICYIVISREHGYTDTVSAAGRHLARHKNTLSDGHSPLATKRPDREELERDKTARKARMKAAILNHLIPAIMQSTKEELEQYGDACFEIAAKLKPGQRVRDVMDEGRVRELLTKGSPKKVAPKHSNAIPQPLVGYV